MDRGAWQATVHSVAKELDLIQQLNNKKDLESHRKSYHCRTSLLDKLIRSEKDLLGLGRKENVSLGDSLSQCPDRDCQASKISVLTTELFK